MGKKSKKIIGLFLVLISIFAVMALTACSNKKNDETITFIDCSGVEITMNKEVNKVIVTDQSCTAFLTAMGCANRIIGVHKSMLIDKWSPIFIGDEMSHMSKYGYRPSAEAIYDVQADIVLLNDATYSEELRKIGVNAVCFAYDNIDELYFAVDMLGTIFGDDARAYVDKWKKYTQETINEITSAVAGISSSEKKDVYYINASNNPSDLYSTFGGNSFVEFWIDLIGGNLVTSEYKDITSIEQEVIIAKNPQNIFIGGYAQYSRKDMLMSDPLWTNIDAVKNNSVYLLPTSLASYEKFSVEFPMLLKYSAHELYPELCSFDGIATLKTFYQDYYHIELSNEYLENLLLGLYPDGTKKDLQ